MSFRNLGRTFALSLFAIAGLSLTAGTHADEMRWLAVTDRSLEVQGNNNPLDFSALQPAAGVAGSHGWAVVTREGHIAFEQQPRPVRFLAASFVFSGLNGGLPSKQEAPRLVQALRRQAYNLVRLHFVDATLMAGRKNDFDFDPDQLDRLFFLLAELKKAGIYWLVDGMTSDNAAYGDVQPNRYVKKHRAKLEVLTSEAGWQHWAKLVEKLWGRTNPYTGISPLKDPAMLGVILVNEGSLAYQATIEGGRYPAALAPGFSAWLRERYADDSGLAKAWARDKRDDESLAGGRVGMPAQVRGRGARDVDFARYVVELEKRGVTRMERHVRDLGFKGLTTAFDNWGFLQTDVSRAASAWVDMHSYASLPSQHGETGSVMEQTSVHSNVARYVRELSNARQWGKPFTVSEWGQPFWNQWRHESALLVPAIAGLQGWDAICQFAETPIQFDYAPKAPKRLQAIYPYGVGGDPIMRAAERLAALIYLRGDLETARHRLRLQLDSEKLLTRSGGWEQVPESLSRLALVTGIGLDVDARPAKPEPNDWVIDLQTDRPVWLSKLESAVMNAGGEALAPEPAVLREQGIIGKNNRTSMRERRYESDTGQLLFDAATHRIVLQTPRTEAVTLVRGGAKLGALEVLRTSGPALYALSSLDGRPLTQSRRMLLFVLTDAQNTGMTFEAGDRRKLRNLGTNPPMLRTVEAQLAYRGGAAGQLRLRPLSLAGERRTPIEGEAIQDGRQWRIDTAALPDGPAVYFELSVEE